MSMDESTRIRCSKEQKRQWERAAAADGRSLASWMRYHLDIAAEKQLKSSKSKE